jgi:hypothetical protein
MVPQLAAHRAVGEKAGPSGKTSSEEAIEIGVWAWPTDYFNSAGMLLKDHFLEVPQGGHPARLTCDNLQQRAVLAIVGPCGLGCWV